MQHAFNYKFSYPILNTFYYIDKYRFAPLSIFHSASFHLQDTIPVSIVSGHVNDDKTDRMVENNLAVAH